MTGVSVALLGPPGFGLVSTYGSVKSWKARIVVVATTKNVVGATDGSVMFRKRCQRFAPSMVAAS